MKSAISTRLKLTGALKTRHLQCLIFSLVLTFAYANHVCMSIVIVAIEKEQRGKEELTPQSIGMILSSFHWGYAVMQIPLGYIAKIWSAKNVLAIGTLISGLVCLLNPIAFDEGGWIALCASGFVMGLGQGSLIPCIHTLLAKWVPPNERGTLATITYAGIDLAMIITYPTSGTLINAVGWRSVFHVFGVASIIWSLILYFIGSDSPAASSKNLCCGINEAERRYIENSLGASEDIQTDDDENSKTLWRAILTSPPFWALFIVNCTDFWGFNVLRNETPSYLAGVLKFDIEQNGVKSAFPYIALFFLTIPVSCLSGWIEKKGLSRGLVRKIWNTIGHWGSALAVVGICFVSPGDTTLPVVLLIVSVGLNAGSNCAYQINHMDLSPKYAGLLVSITNAAASVVALLAPLIVGEVVTDSTNADQWHIVFYITGLIYFLGNLIFILFGSGETQWWNR